MRIKRRLATLLFKGRLSLHIKAPHSFDVRIGVDYSRPFPATERQLNDHTPAVHTSMAGVRRAAANRIGMVEVSVRPGGDVEFGPQMRTLATVRAWRKVPLNVLSATRKPFQFTLPPSGPICRALPQQAVW